MSLSLILCLIKYMLDVGCDFVSISVATDVLPKTHFTNDAPGVDAKFNCEIQRATLDSTSDGSCQLYRWFYDPRSKELTCVCTVQDVANISATLLQGNNTSRMIPAIPKERFVEYSDVQQGEIAYGLQIWTVSEPEETVEKIFLLGADKNTVKLYVQCVPKQMESHVYNCATVLHYKDNVTWEYPENWSGPTRFIRKIAYNESETKIQILSMYWPMLLTDEAKLQYVDTVMNIYRTQIDVCSEFLKNFVDETVKSITKCHLEFAQETSPKSVFQVAKINLLMPVEKNYFWTVERETFRLINQLHRRGENCKFPIMIRQKRAFYVPLEYVEEGNDFEFIVTYHMAESEAKHRYNLTIGQLCKTLANDPRWFLRKCELQSVGYVYATVAVTIESRGASVWELQIHLMFISNEKNRERCDFNVAVKSIAKGY